MKASRERAIDRIQARTGTTSRTLDPLFDRRIKKLVRDWGARKSPAMIEEMIATALKIARDDVSLADLKLINRSAKEMRSAARIFAPFKHLRKVVVFGSARSARDSADYKIATDFACEIVRQGFMVIAGGSEGIMGAVQQGAGRAHSFALGIRLPSEQRVDESIEGDPKLVTLNYFFT
ncbi:MAG TPA: cytochrome D ubiquinol oxidase subunit II, partial [Chthoniobacterales bacterium]|nr:cytochrome D ubiquinol oxidase subunit II [Chthoniobacterales bacterium]